MSMITRCPACQTSFRVVPDQLRMSEGWARCGQCSEIFDAASSLQDDAPLAGREVDSRADIDVDVDPNPNPDTEIESSPDNRSGAELVAQPVAAPVDFVAQEAMALKTALQEIVAARQNFTHESEPRKSSGPADMGHTDDSPMAVNPLQSEANDETAPSFLRELRNSPKRSVWHKTWVRSSLVLVSVGLSLLMVLQMAIHERDRLAMLVPQAKPTLEAVCSYLNCSVSTLRQIDAVVVESSSFTKIRNDVYRLTLAIKNNAPYELAMPALELTLTDAQDQALLRRVLSGSEVNNNNQLSANSEWNGSIELGMRPSGGADRVVGYRVLVFYP